jgi:hypothetical protein
MIKRLVLALGVGSFGAVVGCSDSPERPAGHSHALVEPADFRDPLRDEEVQAFLEVVPRLPGAAAPAFQPSPPGSTPPDATGRQLVERWQREFRHAYNPATQARLWRSDKALSRAIRAADVDPEALASLLVRLSTAVARDALDERVDLVAMRKRAEESIRSLARDFDRLSSEADDAPGTRRSGVRDTVAEALRDATAFREFLRLLEHVPPESIATVGRFRRDLDRYLPTADTVAAFERREETTAVLLPASHEVKAPRREPQH